MLRSIKDLEGYVVDATDGAIGSVRDFYFDDQRWVVRYLIVDTGAWLAGRKVLISPVAIGLVDWHVRLLHVRMTQEQIRNSPDIDTDKPVSRQHEMEYSGYYGYPYYWGGTGYWGGDMYPNLLMPGYGGYGSPEAIRSEEQSAYGRGEAERSRSEDPHLRGCRAVMKYHVHASDGDVGHVGDLLVDDETWAIRYMVVDTSNWWLGHKVLVAPPWIQDIRWLDAKVSVKMTRQSIQEAPAYDPAELLGPTQKLHLHQHYGHAIGDQTRVDAEQVRAEEQCLDDDTDADEEDALTLRAPR